MSTQNSVQAIAPRTMFEKVWQQHVVAEPAGEPTILYIDLQLVHEVTSPQAFDGLRLAGRKLRRPDRHIATVDHNVPTTSVQDRLVIADQISNAQVNALRKNCAEFGVEFFDVQDAAQGIVHMIGPELGATKPGMTIVCGDSHTSTHGAFGALAFGIGTSEVEHVMATQTLRQRKSKNMRVWFDGEPAPGVGAKDYALAMIGLIGTSGGTGYVIEYAGPAIEALSMEGRMTLCNLSIEGGARAGLIAPDEATFDYLRGRPASPKGGSFEAALSDWKRFRSDADAVFDREERIDISKLKPTVTWGTSPEQVVEVGANVPNPADFPPEKAEQIQRALDYMGLAPGQPINEASIDRVFIGSCTNSRIEDLRAAAAIAQGALDAGRKVAAHVTAMVVPGSGLVKEQAESEGLDEIFRAAGFDWREPGCSMCLAMNPDKLEPGERCASTSNRNFEGRQGRGGRTHLMSPAMAAAAAIAGHITDVRELV